MLPNFAAVTVFYTIFALISKIKMYKSSHEGAKLTKVQNNHSF